VGDRSNSRVQVFDNDLKFKAIYDQWGAVGCASRRAASVLYVSNSFPDSNPANWPMSRARFTKWSWTERFLQVRKSRETGWVNSAPCMSWIATVKRADDAEITMWRVQKIILHPAKK